MCPPGSEEMEFGSFRELTWLFIPYMLAGGDSTVRCEEMAGGWNMPDQDPHLLCSFNGACSILGGMCFSRSSLQQDNRIPREIESFLFTQGCKVTHPSQWNVPLQILVDNAFDRCDGAA